MQSTFINILILFTFLTACAQINETNKYVEEREVKDNDETNEIINCEKEGEIVGFNSLKCGGCWGWIIKVGDLRIKSAQLGDKNFGYRFDKPLAVKITIGDSIKLHTSDYPYYEIDCIEKRDSIKID